MGIKRMKRIFLVILLCGILAGCRHIPDQDIIVNVYSSFGPAILLIKEGYLDEENHGKTWIYKHEFDERMKGE